MLNGKKCSTFPAHTISTIRNMDIRVVKSNVDDLAQKSFWKLSQYDLEPNYWNKTISGYADHDDDLGRVSFAEIEAALVGAGFILHSTSLTTDGRQIVLIYLKK
jgi:hypothetical protein